ncbi:Imm32 family immunity protein [Micromonospora taraxaci]|uniref:Imm32 family immunity protein n=1 Tax=Micromonospora taraxaci TaxID=1316803 RepID=UPI003F4CCA84
MAPFEPGQAPGSPLIVSGLPKRLNRGLTVRLQSRGSRHERKPLFSGRDPARTDNSLSVPAFDPTRGVVGPAEGGTVTIEIVNGLVEILGDPAGGRDLARVCLASADSRVADGAHIHLDAGINPLDLGSAPSCLLATRRGRRRSRCPRQSHDVGGSRKRCLIRTPHRRCHLHDRFNDSGRVRCRTDCRERHGRGAWSSTDLSGFRPGHLLGRQRVRARRLRRRASVARIDRFGRGGTGLPAAGVVRDVDAVA